MTWTSPNEAKNKVEPLLKAAREESARLTDTNAKSEKTRAVLLIGLTDSDFANLQTLAARYSKIKNYGVLVRRVLKDAAKSD